MNKNLLALSIFSICVALSCKKDNTPSDAGLTGHWKFDSLTAQTESDNAYTNGGVVYKTVTRSLYTSTQNQGTAVITQDSIMGNGIT
jgi:hypothetical protein